MADINFLNNYLLKKSLGSVTTDPTVPFYNEPIKAKDKFGPEQIAINYLLYRDGFHEMDNGYNFVVQTAKKKIRIKDGVFYYKKSGEKIPIVHNAGGFSFYRPIADFGYGKNKNKIKLVISILKKVLFPIHYFFSKK